MITFKVDQNNATHITYTDRDAQIRELERTINCMNILNKHGALYVTTKPTVDLVYKLLYQHQKYLLSLVGEQE